MKVNEFIKQYEDKLKTNDDFDNFVKSVIATKYISYADKVDTCLRVLNYSCYQKDETTGAKRLHINSTAIHLFYTMNLIKMYTNIEIEFNGDNVIKAYDELQSRGLLDMVFALIPDQELDEFKMILNMCKDDMMKNEYQLGAYVTNRLDNVAKILGTTLSPALEELSSKIENLDEQKVKGIANDFMNSKPMKKIMKMFS